MVRARILHPVIQHLTAHLNRMLPLGSREWELVAMVIEDADPEFLLLEFQHMAARLLRHKGRASSGQGGQAVSVWKFHDAANKLEPYQESRGYAVEALKAVVARAKAVVQREPALPRGMAERWLENCQKAERYISR